MMTTARSVMLFPLSPSDVPAVAAVHLRAFPNQALSRLGIGVVLRYYSWQLIAPHDAACLGAFVESRLVGFCFGGIFRGATSGFLRRNAFYLAGMALRRPWLIANPFMRGRLLDAVRILWRFRKLTSVQTAPAQATERGYGILAIAVDPAAQGLGVGRSLMEAHEQIARERGFKHMGLTVDPRNLSAIAFYERLGWHKIETDQGWRGTMRKLL